MEEVFDKIIGYYENSILQIILYSLTELPFGIGQRKLHSFLRGSKSSFIFEHELFRLKTYGLLPGFNREQFEGIIQGLLSSELIEFEEITRFELQVLKITSEGEAFLKRGGKTDFSFVMDIVDRDFPEFDSDDLELYNDLKKIRYKIAKEIDLPAYCVCNSIVLREIVRHKPGDAEAMLAIKGIGESFVEKYGTRFLAQLKTAPVHSGQDVQVIKDEL